MIVRHESDGSLLMITQNDHAKAAGFVASHWGNSRFAKPQPFESTMRAAFLHDLPWLREETWPRFNPETGQTLNYLNVPNESQLGEYQWANAWLYERDRYAGLLVSKHRTGIWRSRYGLMKQPNYPVRNLSAEIEKQVADSHREQDAVAADYDPLQLTINYILLQVWDLFSLYICSNEHLKEESYEPVPTAYVGGASVCMTLTPVAPGRIGVVPYPFDEPSLDVNVVHRRLPKTVFEHAADFQAVYMRAPLQIATFRFFDPGRA
jgi:Protein of unknown function (DUF3891)